MLEQLKSYWLYGNEYCSIEVCTKYDDIVFHTVTAKKKKDSFLSFNTFTCQTVDDLSKNLSKGQHCILTVNTNKVLVEQVSQLSNDREILAEAFPNLAEDEFYFQILRSSDQAFVSVCRKKYVETLIALLNKVQIKIVRIAIGISEVSNVLPLMEDPIVITSSQKVTLDDTGLISKVETKQEEDQTYNIEGDEFTSGFIVPLAAIPLYLTKPRSKETSLSHKNATLFKNRQEYVFFKKGIYVAIGILLLISMANMLIYNSYKSELRALRSNSSQAISNKENYQERLAEITQKEKMVSNILEGGTSASAFYINSIMASLPETISLSKLAYQPLEKTVQSNKRIVYSNDVIEIAGVLSNNQEFNNWIKELENLSWVALVSTSKYSQTTTSARPEFELQIRIINDSEN